MIISFKQEPGQEIQKVAAIKAFRNATQAGLKEAKDVMDEAEATGSCETSFTTNDVHKLSVSLRGTCYEVTSSLTQLTDMIEQAIMLAVSLKEYKTARALINTLPRDMRAHHLKETDTE